MSGYTPVFDSVFHGTLCGKWPTLPVWLTILPMADKNGHIDMTYQAMSALTGWPIELLKQAIADLCSPDPESRSDEHEGRRLLPIDPHRSWGWIVVNHVKYREKARKAAYDAARTESGADAARKRAERAASRDVPTSPAPSRAIPLSNTNTDSNTNSNSNPDTDTKIARVDVPHETTDDVSECWQRFKASYPSGIYRQSNWLQAEKRYLELVESGIAAIDLAQKAIEYGRQQEALGRLGSQFILSPTNFLKDNEWRGPFPFPKTKAQAAQDKNVSAGLEWLAREGAIDAAD